MIVGIATVSPYAVVLSASDIPPASTVGFTIVSWDMTAKIFIMPDIVPNKPRSVDMLAMVESASTFLNSLTVSFLPASSITPFKVSLVLSRFFMPVWSMRAIGELWLLQYPIASPVLLFLRNASTFSRKVFGIIFFRLTLQSLSMNIPRDIIEQRAIGYMNIPPFTKNSTTLNEYISVSSNTVVYQRLYLCYLHIANLTEISLSMQVASEETVYMLVCPMF